MKFIFQYPIWFIGFCLFLGLLYSFVLYFKDSSIAYESKGFNWVKNTLALFRFLSVSLISFLLLSPLLKSKFVDKIPPSIVLLHDNSSSINLSFSKLDSTSYLANLNNMYTAIKEKYALNFYIFSDKAYAEDTLSFTAKKTNISNTLEQLNGNYFNRNVGAVIIATDGIYNEGNNPIYTAFDFPIYAIALGDTSQQRDLKIAQVNANKIAYLDDEVQVDVLTECIAAGQKNVSVELLSKNAKRLAIKKINLKKPYQEDKISFVLKASKVGIQKYSVRISSIENEVSYQNNQTDFYIDVIDTKQNVLLLANAPHPDLAALKQSMAPNKNLNIETAYIKNFSKKIDKYNLIILHNLPSASQDTRYVFNQIKKEKNPYLLIAGAQTELKTLNTLQSIVNIKPSAANQNEATSAFNENFNLFTLDASTKNKLRKFPPVSLAFGSYTMASSAKPILYQKIGQIVSDYPLLVFNESLGTKSAIFIGEGLWRWRLHDYLENDSHDAFDELFQKTINYLAVKADKRKFRVRSEKNIYFETEPVILEAQLYNESYELVNEPEIKLTVKNDNNESFPLAMSRINGAYILKTNSLPVGNYTYTASTNYAGKRYTASGAFGVKALQLEAIQTQANHKVLFQLANKTNGKVFYPNEIDKLQELILNKEDIRPTLYERFKTQSIINLKWLFFLILGLLSIEWFVRKYNGSY